ncbi:hypothetical protein C0J52_12018, partial [Blattella germanica]
EGLEDYSDNNLERLLQDRAEKYKCQLADFIIKCNAHASGEAGTATTDRKTAATTAHAVATCGARTADASAWASSRNGGNNCANCAARTLDNLTTLRSRTHGVQLYSSLFFIFSSLDFHLVPCTLTTYTILVSMLHLIRFQNV